jgi:hypothetical protein
MMLVICLLSVEPGQLVAVVKLVRDFCECTYLHWLSERVKGLEKKAVFGDVTEFSNPAIILTKETTTFPWM